MLRDSYVGRAEPIVVARRTGACAVEGGSLREALVREDCERVGSGCGVLGRGVEGRGEAYVVGRGEGLFVGGRRAVSRVCRMEPVRAGGVGSGLGCGAAGAWGVVQAGEARGLELERRVVVLEARCGWEVVDTESWDDRSVLEGAVCFDLDDVPVLGVLVETLCLPPPRADDLAGVARSPRPGSPAPLPPSISPPYSASSRSFLLRASSRSLSFRSSSSMLSLRIRSSKSVSALCAASCAALDSRSACSSCDSSKRDAVAGAGVRRLSARARDKASTESGGGLCVVSVGVNALVVDLIRRAS